MVTPGREIARVSYFCALLARSLAAGPPLLLAYQIKVSMRKPIFPIAPVRWSADGPHSREKNR